MGGVGACANPLIPQRFARAFYIIIGQNLRQHNVAQRVTTSKLHPSMSWKPFLSPDVQPPEQISRLVKAILQHCKLLANPSHLYSRRVSLFLRHLTAGRRDCELASISHLKRLHELLWYRFVDNGAQCYFSAGSAAIHGQAHKHQPPDAAPVSAQAANVWANPSPTSFQLTAQ